MHQSHSFVTLSCVLSFAQDVADCVAATDATLQLSPPVVDATRVAVIGGSHGGFLTGHLIGQHVRPAGRKHILSSTNVGRKVREYIQAR